MEVGLPLRAVIPWYAEVANETLPLGWVPCDGRTVLQANHDIIDPQTSTKFGDFTVPDLRNKFILPADETKALSTAGAAIGAANVNTPGGAPGSWADVAGNQTSLTLATQLPGHIHQMGNTSISASFDSQTHTHVMASAGSHSHGGTATGGTHQHTLPSLQGYTGIAGAPGIMDGTPFDPFYFSVYETFATGSANPTSHAHGIGTDGAHTHVVDAANLPTHKHDMSFSGGSTENTGTGDPHENRPAYVGVIYIIKVLN